MVKMNGKDVPVVQAKVTTTIKNKKTGTVYSTEEEWKALNIPAEDIQRDIHVLMPSLDLFGKTQ